MEPFIGSRVSLTRLLANAEKATLRVRRFGSCHWPEASVRGSSPQASLTWAVFPLVTGQSYSNVAIMLDSGNIRRLDRSSPSMSKTRVLFTRSLAIIMQGPGNSRKGPKFDVSLCSLRPGCVTVLALLGGDNVTVATGHYCMAAN